MPEPFSATAPLKSVKGTSTKPGVTFTGDENTGLYNPAPDELAVSLGGSEKAKFTGTGVNLDGDITLDDGGTYETTVQVVTPTANRTISFPDATGTVALVAGSSGQFIYNNAGALEGLSTLTTDGTNITLSARFISSLNGALSATGIAGVPVAVTGTWITGGTATTTKPHVLIEPTGTTSTSWDTDGTGIGVNAPSGFSGNLLDLQVNGSSRAYFGADASLSLPAGSAIYLDRNSTNGIVIGNYAGRHVRLGSSTSILFSSGQPTGVIDLQIKRDQANVLVVTDGSTGTGYVKQVPVLVSELPAAATVGAGTRGFVSDATSTTFAADPVGGGANTVPVYSDGTNWLIG